jgi:hypothetical protein
LELGLKILRISNIWFGTRGVNPFRDLGLYQGVFNEDGNFYITENLLFEEKYSLTDQIKRLSRVGLFIH